MTRTVLKKKIHNCVDHINDDKILEAVYTLLNGHVNDDYELSSDDLKIINARRKAILSGEEKTYTVAEVKKKLLKNIGK
ncbi:MAG: hypothetical protein Q8M29_06250 [Bacteroidota bacterium]|nr:hypothetical protein [Bacteroidota bacterium]